MPASGRDLRPQRRAARPLVERPVGLRPPAPAAARSARASPRWRAPCALQPARVQRQMATQPLRLAQAPGVAAARLAAVDALQVPGVGALRGAARFYPHGAARGPRARLRRHRLAGPRGPRAALRPRDPRRRRVRIEVDRDAHGREFLTHGADTRRPRRAAASSSPSTPTIQHVTERELAAGVQRAKARRRRGDRARSGRPARSSRSPTTRPSIPTTAVRLGQPEAEAAHPQSDAVRSLRAGLDVQGDPRRQRARGGRRQADGAHVLRERQLDGRQVDHPRLPSRTAGCPSPRSIQYSSNIGATKVGDRLGRERYYAWLQRVRLRPAHRHRAARTSRRASCATASLGAHRPRDAQLRAGHLGHAAADGRGVRRRSPTADVSCSPTSCAAIASPTARCVLRASSRRSCGRVLIERDGAARPPSSCAASSRRRAAPGRRARLDEFTVAGKTGTAQKVDPRTRAATRRNASARSSASSRPTRPRAVILVLIDEPHDPATAASSRRRSSARSRSGVMQAMRVAPERQAPAPAASGPRRSSRRGRQRPRSAAARASAAATATRLRRPSRRVPPAGAVDETGTPSYLGLSHARGAHARACRRLGRRRARHGLGRRAAPRPGRTARDGSSPRARAPPGSADRRSPDASRARCVDGLRTPSRSSAPSTSTCAASLSIRAGSRPATCSSRSPATPTDGRRHVADARRARRRRGRRASDDARRGRARSGRACTGRRARLLAHGRRRVSRAIRAPRSRWSASPARTARRPRRICSKASGARRARGRASSARSRIASADDERPAPLHDAGGARAAGACSPTCARRASRTSRWRCRRTRSAQDRVGRPAASTPRSSRNLTRDHLDFHGDMEAYYAAKARLFLELLPASGKPRAPWRS